MNTTTTITINDVGEEEEELVRIKIDKSDTLDGRLKVSFVVKTKKRSWIMGLVYSILMMNLLHMSAD